MSKQVRARAFARVFAVLVSFAVPVLVLAQNAQFTATGGLVDAREGHTATMLPNGMVLISGDAYGITPTIELYDPAAGTFTGAGNSYVPAGGQTATLLWTGKVLFTGGIGPGGAGVRYAFLYDPDSRSFSWTGSMSAGRRGHSATLLPNGKVLVAGGSAWTGQYWATSATAELYDPATGTFTTTGSLATPRERHSASLLPNGKVLIAGGTFQAGPYYNSPWTCLATAELYDPATGQFTSTGSMTTIRNSHTAAVLPGGKVLVVGGDTYEGANGTTLASAELYDMGSGAFTSTGSLHWGRLGHTMTALPNGKVLVAGGNVFRYYKLPDQTTEIYDPATGAFADGPLMITARASFTATLLPNGRVLMAAGSPGPDKKTATAELYGNPALCY